MSFWTARGLGCEGKLVTVENTTLAGAHLLTGPTGSPLTAGQLIGTARRLRRWQCFPDRPGRR